ncbi:hypothetical protein EZV62_011873 [Acer yangbiense]|uniref:CCHC-type domain-containing protein n=1 Tax=Acer yangbiense TaxID=1000413 RepID=A0A5C7I7X9_9ROSI|nr:hypothetical protein EZV62_011873 [Acer yangbiense]
MATGSNASLHIPQFSGENYNIWVVKMRSYLKSFGLWEFVDQDKQIPPLRANPTIAQIKQHEEEKMKKDKTVTCLHSALTDSVFTSIMHLETAKEIWDELKERYEGSERVKNVKMLTLKREFEILKMKESKSVKDYSFKLSELVNQMRLYGETVEDHKVVEKMLISLPEKFEAKVPAIEESCDLKKLTSSEMISKLQAHEQRMSMRKDDVTEGAFQARLQEKQNLDKGKGKMDGGSSESAGKSKFPPCSTCKRTNHLSKDCWHKGKPQFQCNYCKRWGHKENVCRLKPNQMQPQPAQQANFTDEQPEAEDHLFTMSQACCSVSKDVWYVDSGCTSHMVWDSSLFTSLDRNDRTKIKLGNGEMVQATGKGTIFVHTSKGPKLISDVLLIPELDQNLLSVAQLLKKGYACLFKDNCCIISNSCGVEIVKVEMVDKSFPFNMDQVNFSTLVSKNNDTAQWNKNYGHCNMDALKKLKKNVMVKDVQATYSTYGLRDTCQNGKSLMEPHIDEVFDVVSSNKFAFNYGAVADGKTKSLADNYEKCNLMMNEPACYKKAAQIDEKKLAMEEELMMKKNQARSSAKAEYIIAAAPNQAKWMGKHGRTKHNNVKFHAIREAEKYGDVQLMHYRSEEQMADILTKASAGNNFNVL